jgi:hypothetical protein
VRRLAAALLTTAALFAQSAPELPAPVRAALNQGCPGWRLAPVAPQIEDWFRGYRLPYRPNLATGDFNDDGRPDLAVQILCSLDGKPRQLVFGLVARSDSGYQMFPLANDTPDPFTFLIVYKKGEKDFDFEAMKPFRYASDSLGLLYFDRTALTFRWTGKGFEKREAPGDEEVEAAAIEAAEAQPQ